MAKTPSRKTAAAAKSSRSNASTPPEVKRTQRIPHTHQAPSADALTALPDSPEKRAYLTLLNFKAVTTAHNAALAEVGAEYPLVQAPAGLALTDAMNGAFLSAADYRRWVGKDAWTLESAVCLAHGYPPDIAQVIDIKRQGIPLSVTPPLGKDGTVRLTYEAATEAILAGKLECIERMGMTGVTPESFLRWYVTPRPAIGQHDPERTRKIWSALPGPLQRVIKALGLPDPTKPQDGNGVQSAKRATGKGGRPRKYNPDKDREVWFLWQESGYSTYEEFIQKYKLPKDLKDYGTKAAMHKLGDRMKRREQE